LDSNLIPNSKNGTAFALSFQTGSIGMAIESTETNYAMLTEKPDEGSQAAKYDLLPGDYVIRVGNVNLANSGYNGVEGFQKARNQQSGPHNIIFFRFEDNHQFGQINDAGIVTLPLAAAGNNSARDPAVEAEEEDHSERPRLQCPKGKDEDKDTESDGDSAVPAENRAAPAPPIIDSVSNPQKASSRRRRESATTRNIFAYSSAVYSLALSIDTNGAWKEDGCHISYHDLQDFGWNRLSNQVGFGVWCCPHVTSLQDTEHDFNTFSLLSH
jgi:hypothetical protein